MDFKDLQALLVQRDRLVPEDSLVQQVHKDLLVLQALLLLELLELLDPLDHQVDLLDPRERPVLLVQLVLKARPVFVVLLVLPEQLVPLQQFRDQRVRKDQLVQRVLIRQYPDQQVQQDLKVLLVQKAQSAPALTGLQVLAT